MSTYIRKFWKFIKRNETARGLLLVGIVILGALAVWGGVRLALSTEYPVLVVSSGSMCPPTNCVLPIGSLIVIRGQDPSTIVAAPPPSGSIIVFRPYVCEPDYLVVHRVINEVKDSNGYSFVTKGDNNGGSDSWDARCGTALTMISSSQVVGVYQGMVPVPYLGSAILGIRSFMYDDTTGQPRPEGILVIVILIVALFAFEVIEPSKKPKPEASTSSSNVQPIPIQGHISSVEEFPNPGGA
ncbi:signal peptidase I [Candidatus Bathyarchaeota archaeon]|nr:MAG: signal peptidase I [Candidatus Bathyarchaeota archaeon]